MICFRWKGAKKKKKMGATFIEISTAPMPGALTPWCRNGTFHHRKCADNGRCIPTEGLASRPSLCLYGSCLLGLSTEPQKLLDEPRRCGRYVPPINWLDFDTSWGANSPPPRLIKMVCQHFEGFNLQAGCESEDVVLIFSGDLWNQSQCGDELQLVSITMIISPSYYLLLMVNRSV